jgi:hypothetical protein
MPTAIPVNNMAKPRANNKRTAASNKKIVAAKTAHTSELSASTALRQTEPSQANLKDPPPTATSADNAASIALVGASETTYPTARVATRAPVSTVHLPGTDGGSEDETGTDDLTKATAATTVAYSGLDSPTSIPDNMKWAIRNYVTQYFFSKREIHNKERKTCLLSSSYYNYVLLCYYYEELQFAAGCRSCRVVGHSRKTRGETKKLHNCSPIR